MKCPFCGHEPFEVNIDIRRHAEGEIDDDWNLDVETLGEEIDDIKCYECGEKIDTDKIKGWIG